MNSFERYSLRKKRVLDVCTNVVKDTDIRDLLLNKTGCKCEKISMSRYTAVRSKLSGQNYALISNMVIKAVKLICETIYHGEFKDTLNREKDGVRVC